MNRLLPLCGVIGLGLLAGLSTSPAMAVAIPFVATGNTDIGDPPADPVEPGSYSVSFIGPDVIHTVSGGGGDWWDWGERAHVAYAQMPAGDFRLETAISPVPIPPEDPNNYDYWVKAGLFLRNVVPGTAREVNAIMAALRSNRNDSAFQWRPDGGNNWMGNIQRGGLNPPQKLLLQRRTLAGVTFVEGAVSFDGTNFELVSRQILSNLAAQPYGGLFVTAHRNQAGHLLTVDFTNPIVDTETVEFPAPPERALAFTPPSGGAGNWGVREVLRPDGGVGNLSDTVFVLNQNAADPGWGQRDDRQRPFIDMHDSGGTGRFPYNQNYGVVEAGYKDRGSVDNIAVVMSGWIEVPETDWYTFDVNSDDGFELSVDHRIVMEANYGKGASDVLGQAYLTAGVHPIRVLYWEGGGGAAVEVMSARGFKTGFDGSFNLIGAPAIPGYTIWVPGILGDVTIESATPGYNNPRAENRDTAIQQIINARAEGQIHTALADQVNHNDPQTGGSGHFGGDLPFPNNTDGDDNDFATMATGLLFIPTSGTYYIGYASDDGMALQIEGGVWEAVVENATGQGQIDPLDPSWLVTNAWTGDSFTVGRITLSAGIYPFTAVTYEGGGGSFMEMFGSTKQGQYYLILSGAGQQINVPEVPAGLALVVPEPGSLGLLAMAGLLGLAGLAWCRRRS